MRSTCCLCGCALACQEEIDRGLCDPCWSPSRVRSGSSIHIGWLVLVILVGGGMGLQVASLERELDAARARAAAVTATQEHQDAAILAAERTLVELGPPCAALVDLHPALSPRLARRQR
jgi:hypothetical protein